MIAEARRKIAADLARIAKDAEEHPADPFDIAIQSRRVAAQAEMLERGIAE